MWKYLVFSATGVLLCIFLLSSCGKNDDKKSGNPISPPVETETYTASGRVYFSSSLTPKKVVLHLRGNGVEKTVTSEEDGSFSIPGLEEGKYSVLTEQQGFVAYPDTLEFMIPEGKWSIDIAAFAQTDYDSFKKKDCSAIFGRITTEDGRPVSLVEVSTAKSGVNGFFHILSSKGINHPLAPKKNGYEYSFSPDSLSIFVDTTVLFVDFIAYYSGPPLHSISGKVVTSDHSLRATVSLYEGKTLIVSTVPDSTGSYVFSDIKDGSYIVKYVMPDYTFIKNNVKAVLNGADIVLSDATSQFSGKETFAISGKIVTAEGKRFSRASVKVYPSGNPKNTQVLKTDSTGVFTFSGVTLDKNVSKQYIIQPYMDVATFIPENAIVTLHWNGVRDGGTVTIPDFVVRDFSGITASGYFPLRNGASWTYARTALRDSLKEYTILISGRNVLNGKEYFQSTVPGPAGFTDFCIDGNSVLTLYRAKDTEILRFCRLPGANWEIGRAYPTSGSFIGLETATVPAGTYTDCAKYEIRTIFGGTSYEFYTLWFAKGVGMVRSEYTLVNYKDTKESVTLALKSYTP